jgi:hypothetical protein
MAARPQTLYGIADSPVGLAAWLLDHDGGGEPAAAVVEALGRAASATGELTRDEILDNITLFWLSNTGSLRLVSIGNTRVALPHEALGARPDVPRQVDGHGSAA